VELWHVRIRVEVILSVGESNMALSRCADCGNDVSELARVCPVCGRVFDKQEYELRQQVARANEWFAVIGLATGVAVVIGVILWYILPSGGFTVGIVVAAIATTAYVLFRIVKDK
jgi:hypothetical protein